MKLPDGRPLVVAEGVLPEPPSGEGRIVLWIPGGSSGGYRHWDRLGTVGGAVEAVQGVQAVEAAVVPARRRIGSGIGGLVRRLMRPRGGRTWVLPDGATVEQCGPRRADVRLAWAGVGSTPLDEARVKAAWPGCREARRVGEDLWVVFGVEPARKFDRVEAAAELPPSTSPRPPAEQALARAREAGDRLGEVTALVDLGLAFLLEGDAGRATALFEEALEGARRLGDRAREADATSSLAQAALFAGQPARALEFLGPALALAREAGDRYAEKVVLERLGHAYRDLGNHSLALDYFERGLETARGLGDHGHAAVLSWQAAIQNAELGRPGPAAARGQAAVDLLRRLGQPQADWYANHLANYRAGAPAASLSAARVGFPAGGLYGGAIATNALASPPVPHDAQRPTAAGPGLLRMALTATQAMAKFVGSGFQTAGPDVYQARLAACSACEHHTGLRCRVCGCVTAAKARLLHERCPTGRWPS